MPSCTRISHFIGTAFLLLGFRSTVGWTSCPRWPRLSHRSSVMISSSTSDSDVRTSIPAAGIPPELENLALFEYLDCDGGDTPTASESDKRRRVQRVSIDPPVFILKNAVAPEECRYIRTVAASMASQMEEGKTASEDDGYEDPRKHSKVGWLANDQPEIEAVARRGHGIFLNGMPFHATRGIEPLQVVHYHSEGGEYVNHHDGNGRLLTVLYYLNGVGATWFPLAGSKAKQEGGNDNEIRDLLEARRASADKSPGQSGVLVTCRTEENENENNGIVARVNEGDAVAFYSYKVDGSMNWKAFHSGLPVTKDDLSVSLDNNDNNGNENKGGKWIANHFYHFVPSHIPETPPPKSK